MSECPDPKRPCSIEGIVKLRFDTICQKIDELKENHAADSKELKKGQKDIADLLNGPEGLLVRTSQNETDIAYIQERNKSVSAWIKSLVLFALAQLAAMGLVLMKGGKGQ